MGPFPALEACTVRRDVARAATDCAPAPRMWAGVGCYLGYLRVIALYLGYLRIIFVILLASEVRRTESSLDAGRRLNPSNPIAFD